MKSHKKRQVEVLRKKRIAEAAITQEWERRIVGLIDIMTGLEIPDLVMPDADDDTPSIPMDLVVYSIPK